jgi:hypothetical protein
LSRASAAISGGQSDLEALEPAGFATAEWCDLDGEAYEGVLWKPATVPAAPAGRP